MTPISTKNAVMPRKTRASAFIDRSTLPARRAARRGLGLGVWWRSQTGRSERIGGSESKLCSGGGDVVAHSSVWPPHGSSPAGSPCRNECDRFQMNASTPTARMYDPIVEIRFSVPHPSDSRYGRDAARHAVETELVLHEERQVDADEERPEVHLAPASRSSILPVIFGNQ